MVLATTNCRHHLAGEIHWHSGEGLRGAEARAQSSSAWVQPDLKPPWPLSP